MRERGRKREREREQEGGREKGRGEKEDNHTICKWVILLKTGKRRCRFPDEIKIKHETF